MELRSYFTGPLAPSSSSLRVKYCWLGKCNTAKVFQFVGEKMSGRTYRLFYADTSGSELENFPLVNQTLYVRCRALTSTIFAGICLCHIKTNF